MATTDTATDYDSSAVAYDRLRSPCDATVTALKRAFSSVVPCGTVLSLGCGTGQYEEAVFGGRSVVGVDRSREMLRIARKRIPKCVQADMTSLPFADRMFDGVCFVQSLHHVGANLNITPQEREEARKTALREAYRVLRSGPIAIVQRDPSQNEAVWFWKYFPTALATKLVIQPRIETVESWLTDLGFCDLMATAVDDPMISGFYSPEAPLDPAFQRSFSEFSYLSSAELETGMEELRSAISEDSVEAEIEACRRTFAQIGGTVFVLSGRRP